MFYISLLSEVISEVGVNNSFYLLDNSFNYSFVKNSYLQI